MTASSQSMILPPRARFDYEQISLCICSSDSCRTSDGMIFAAAGSPCRTATTRAVAWFQVGAVFNRTKTAVGGGSRQSCFPPIRGCHLDAGTTGLDSLPASKVAARGHSEYLLLMVRSSSRRSRRRATSGRGTCSQFCRPLSFQPPNDTRYRSRGPVRGTKCEPARPVQIALSTGSGQSLSSGQRPGPRFVRQVIGRHLDSEATAVNLNPHTRLGNA